MPRKDGRKNGQRSAAAAESPKQAAFLAAYIECGGNSAVASRMAGVSRSMHSYWTKTDADYPAKFAEAHKEACELIEAEIHRRAVIGVDEPIVWKGQIQTVEVKEGKGTRCIPVTIKKYSDVLLMFLAKKLMPEYRDRVGMELSGGLNNQSTVKVVEDEGWYGNDAHDRARSQAAEGSTAPGAAIAVAGAVQAADLRSAVRQDGGGAASGGEGAWPEEREPPRGY